MPRRMFRLSDILPALECLMSTWTPWLPQEAIVFNNILRLVSPDFSEVAQEPYLILSFDRQDKGNLTKTS